MTKFKKGDIAVQQPWPNSTNHPTWGHLLTIISVGDGSCSVKPVDPSVWHGGEYYMSPDHLVLQSEMELDYGHQVVVEPWETSNQEFINLFGQTGIIVSKGVNTASVKFDDPSCYVAGQELFMLSQLKYIGPGTAIIKLAKKQKPVETNDEPDGFDAADLTPETMICKCDSETHKYHSLYGGYEQPLWWTKDEQFCAKTSAPDDFWENYSHGSDSSPPDEQIDPISLAADFYLLEAAKNGMLGETDDPDGMRVARQDFDKLVAHAAPLMREYLWYAVCSELTYHSAFKKSFKRNSWSDARYGWDLLMQQYGEEQACDWAIEMFEQDGMWAGAYGGKPWADIVRVLRYKAIGKIGKQKFSDAMFLDRMFSLQHNTCTVFNKSCWTVQNDWGMDYDSMSCKCETRPECGCNNVLNMHALGNMTGMLALASPPVVTLIKDQWDTSGYGEIVPDAKPTYGGYSNSPTLIFPGGMHCAFCNSELLKDESKATGFCTVCRDSLKGSAFMDSMTFWQTSSFAWTNCSDGIGCSICVIEDVAYNAYAKYESLMASAPKKVAKKVAKKAAKKAPVKYTKNMPTVKLSNNGFPTFAELMEQANNIDKNS